MKTEVIHFSAKSGASTVQEYIYTLFSGGGTNDRDREKMKRILKSAVSIELTERQRFCLLEYYKGKSQVQIARELGLNKATVSRHVNAAVSKLRAVAWYYSL